MEKALANPLFPAFTKERLDLARSMPALWTGQLKLLPEQVRGLYRSVLELARSGFEDRYITGEMIWIGHTGHVTSFSQNDQPSLELVRSVVIPVDPEGSLVEIAWVKFDNRRAMMVVDEEGLLKGLPYNPVASFIYSLASHKDGCINPYEFYIAGDALLLLGTAEWRD